MAKLTCPSCGTEVPIPGRKRSGGIRRDSADVRFSKQVRERDGWACQWPGCGKLYPPPSSGGLEAAHCFSRRIKATRLDLENALSLCTAHHFHADSHPLEKYALFRSVLGDERFEALQARAKGKRDRSVA